MSDEMIGDRWYFYAHPRYEYYYRLDQEAKKPALFIGPYDSRDDAIAAYREWKQTHAEEQDETD